jgi:hypothetical protein
LPNKKITPTSVNKTTSPRGILELERFTEENITQWNYASENLNELEDVLYFNLEFKRYEKTLERFQQEWLAISAQHLRSKK